MEYTSWNVQHTCLQLTPAPRYQFWIASASFSSCLLMCNIYHVVNRWGPSSVTFLRQGFWTRVSACFRHIAGFYWTCCQDGSDDVLYPFYLQHTHTHTHTHSPGGPWHLGDDSPVHGRHARAKGCAVSTGTEVRRGQPCKEIVRLHQQEVLRVKVGWGARGGEGVWGWGRVCEGRAQKKYGWPARLGCVVWALSFPPPPGWMGEGGWRSKCVWRYMKGSLDIFLPTTCVCAIQSSPPHTRLAFLRNLSIL